MKQHHKTSAPAATIQHSPPDLHCNIEHFCLESVRHRSQRVGDLCKRRPRPRISRPASFHKLPPLRITPFGNCRAESILDNASYIHTLNLSPMIMILMISRNACFEIHLYITYQWNYVKSLIPYIFGRYLQRLTTDSLQTHTIPIQLCFTPSWKYYST